MPETLFCRNVKQIRIQPEIAHRESCFLNTLDHFQSWFLVEVVYFYQQTLDPARLERSLLQTMREFPQLCGQLKQAPDGRLCISYPHAGALLTVCECDRSMAEITSGLHEKFTLYDFIEKINPFLLTLRNRPLITFRITHTKGGGSVLGISVSHALADAYSFFYFIRHWSQTHEGQPAEAPLHNRSLIACNAESARNLPAALPQTCRGFRLLTSGQMLKFASRFLRHQRSIVCRVLRFSSSQVSVIKAAADQRGPVSLTAALSAHLWQFCMKLSGTADNSARCKLLVPANIRPRIDHPRAEWYFGNAVSHVEVTGNPSELANAAIASVADQCRQQVARLDQDHIREQMHWLTAAEQRRQLYRVYADMNPYAGDCLIGSLYRMPVYAAQFDGEKPFWAEVPVIPIPWVLQLFPAAGENSGIDVHAHIPRTAADKLKLPAWQHELYKYGDTAEKS